MTDEQQIAFDQVRAMLQKHMPPLVAVKDIAGEYHVSVGKPVVVNNRKMDPMWFGVVKANKVSVTLHYMPVYWDPSLAEQLPPVFMKTLKGQACFQVDKGGPELMAAVEDAIGIGIKAFQSRDWL
jgi:hypothetical protein